MPLEPSASPPGPGGALRLGRQTFAPGRPVVMGIVNRTPDSFFDRGATWAESVALDAVDRAVSDGADIIDIGGVKAAPGAAVHPGEEVERTAGFIAAVRTRYPDVVISVDTWRAAVAREAVAQGADLLNDAWGGVEPELAEVAAELGVGLVCTHAGGQQPRTRPHRREYLPTPPPAPGGSVRDGAVPHGVLRPVSGVVSAVVAGVLDLAGRAVALGVRPDGVVIDPGHDFGKSTRHSVEVTRRIADLVATGWPVLVALSNKDFIGEALDLPVDERLEGTLAATAVCAWQGVRLFRAHQVRETRRVVDMVAVLRGDADVRVARRGLA